MLSVNSSLHLTPRSPSESEWNDPPATRVAMRMKPGAETSTSGFIEQKFAGGCYQ